MEETDRLFRALMGVCEAMRDCPNEGERAKLFAGVCETARYTAVPSLSGEWLATVRQLLPYVERAIDERRRFIRNEREVVRVDQVKRVTSETVRHLGQHTEYITKIDRDGYVQPERLMTVEREENHAIYENRFLYTLVTQLQQFLIREERRYMEAAGSQSVQYGIAQANDQEGFHLEGRFDRLPGEQAADTGLDELRELKRRVDMLMGMPLMRQLHGTTLVRYPIVRTNLIKKDPYFQKSLELYEFLIRNQDGLLKIDFRSEPSRFVREAADALGTLSALMRQTALLGTNSESWRAAQQEFMAENERRRQAAIEEERRREQEVQRRIQQARDEEIAIRIAEVNKREEQIARLNEKLEDAREREAAMRAEAKRREDVCRQSTQSIRDELNKLLRGLESAQ